jgi:hypothetical protein
MHHNGWVYETFGISKHFPVKPLQSLLDVTPLKLALSVKCFIYRVRGWCLFILYSLSVYYKLLNLSIEVLPFPKKLVFRVGKKALADRQALLQFLVEALACANCNCAWL